MLNFCGSQGAKIGERVNIYAPNKTLIDMTRPWLIDIGNDVQITEDVTILTHGYDWAVLKRCIRRSPRFVGGGGGKDWK